MNTRIIKVFLFSFALCNLCLTAFARVGKSFTLKAGQPVTLLCDTAHEEPVVKAAIKMAGGDFYKVLASKLAVNTQKGNIVVGTIGKSKAVERCGVDLSALKGQWEAFIMAVTPKGQLLIAGSDAHGTAYGLLELSRSMGVSPWEWWADVTPEKRSSFSLPAGYRDSQQPDVPFRGIFINDEDWGIMPWASTTYEPEAGKGTMGPKTYARIFELLLRLRANTCWPAMHPVTKPFFLTPGNSRVAGEYGIYIGTSHCEPMACNPEGEWRKLGTGAFDYLHNKDNVMKYWENRIKQVANQEIIYTLGMRGVGDGQMIGANTPEEQRNTLVNIFNDQRSLLSKYVNKDVTKVPQVFIPYKEVENVYNSGLKVPEDVCLMWCDDNFGYIRHFPSDAERARKGGNGMYYHVSYWGLPHDYLWLGTFSPYLLHQQMKEAYNRGIRKMWILNVGDIKPAEYQTELFMDMAWNINAVEKKGVANHLSAFLTREFGAKVSKTVAPAMNEYYRLAYIRKPEHLGNTRVYEADPKWNVVKDLPWSKSYINNRLAQYDNISSVVCQAGKAVPANRTYAYYQLVKYPVLAANQMNKKLLYAQLARHGKADWMLSDVAYDSIRALTHVYNSGLNNEGKWKHFMDSEPRGLTVFHRVPHTTVSTPLPQDTVPAYKFNAATCSAGTPTPYNGLGYEGKAAGIAKGETVGCSFGRLPKDSALIELRFVPTQPIIARGKLRVQLSVDGGSPVTVEYQAYDHTEPWKEYVLNNVAIRRVRVPLSAAAHHNIAVKAIDEGVVLDQIFVY